MKNFTLRAKYSKVHFEESSLDHSKVISITLKEIMFALLENNYDITGLHAWLKNILFLKSRKARIVSRSKNSRLN